MLVAIAEPFLLGYSTFSSPRVTSIRPSAKLDCSSSYLQRRSFVVCWNSVVAIEYETQDRDMKRSSNHDKDITVFTELWKWIRSQTDRQVLKKITSWLCGPEDERIHLEDNELRRSVRFTGSRQGICVSHL
ncbi:hypothetical protein J6590_072710 [Homalodisca vitripennis]|nr:hypothetical protein J6590_072710 [Homalodisca vitripennis]